MAKPDDTRITHVPANAKTGSTPTTSNTIPSDTELIHVLEALLAAARVRLANNKAKPLPPKSARAPTIKPRRRVTVRGGVIPGKPGSDANMPWIRLCGNWLVPVGFGLHKRVRVHVATDCLILIPEGVI